MSLSRSRLSINAHPTSHPTFPRSGPGSRSSYGLSITSRRLLGPGVCRRTALSRGRPVDDSTTSRPRAAARQAARLPGERSQPTFRNASVVIALPPPLRPGAATRATACFRPPGPTQLLGAHPSPDERRSPPARWLAHCRWQDESRPRNVRHGPVWMGHRRAWE